MNSRIIDNELQNNNEQRNFILWKITADPDLNLEVQFLRFSHYETELHNFVERLLNRYTIDTRFIINTDLMNENNNYTTTTDYRSMNTFLKKKCRTRDISSVFGGFVIQEVFPIEDDNQDDDDEDGFPY
jgi:hypothetical protein